MMMMMRKIIMIMMTMTMMRITPGTFGVPQSDGPKLTTPINCHLSENIGEYDNDNDDDDDDDDDDDSEKLPSESKY